MRKIIITVLLYCIRRLVANSSIVDHAKKEIKIDGSMTIEQANATINIVSLLEAANKAGRGTWELVEKNGLLLCDIEKLIGVKPLSTIDLKNDSSYEKEIDISQWRQHERCASIYKTPNSVVHLTPTESPIELDIIYDPQTKTYTTNKICGNKQWGGYVYTLNKNYEPTTMVLDLEIAKIEGDTFLDDTKIVVPIYTVTIENLVIPFASPTQKQRNDVFTLLFRENGGQWFDDDISAIVGLGFTEGEVNNILDGALKLIKKYDTKRNK